MQMPEDPTRVVLWIQDKLESRMDYYQGRDTMMEFDRRLLLQNYRHEMQGTASIQSAEPRNTVRLALDIMTRRELKFQATISKQPADEQDNINNMERFSMGLWRATDRQWRQQGNRGFLRDLDWYIVMGGYAIAPLVEDTPQGTRFSARVLDPINVYPDYDEHGMCWVAHSYWETMKQAKPRFLKNSDWNISAIAQKSDADEVQIINCFWLDPVDDDENILGVWNAITVDGILVKPPKHEKQFNRRLPILVGPASGSPFNWRNNRNRSPLNDGGMPWMDTANGSTTQWDSILAPARRSYADLDSYLSYAAEITRRNALGRYVQKTRNGAPSISVPQFRNMELGSMKIGEDIVPIPPPQAPSERNELLAYFTQSIQRSTLSFTAYGTLGIEISGVTLDSLNNATQSVLAPFLQTSEYAISEMILSYVEQFRAGKFKTVSLEARDRAGTDVAERWFLQDFKRTEIPQSALLNVTQSLALPDTTLARINAARSAVGDNRQLVSQDIIDEKLLSDLVPDSQLNKEQISADKTRNSPQITAAETIEGLRVLATAAQERGDTQLEKVYVVLMQQTMAQFQQVIAGAEQAVAGVNTQREAQAGASITEPSPGMSPPEASGVGPDALAQGGNGAGNEALRGLIEKRAASVNGGR